MMTTNNPIMFPGETYTSVRATPDLVGFADERKAIREAVTNGHPSYLIYITGIGGIGKTRLLRHMLQELIEEANLLVASELVDLYHSSVHTDEGMLDALERALTEEGKRFTNYHRARNDLERQIVNRPDQIARIRELRQEMLTAFANDLENLAHGRRIVIALDTAEKLIFPEDPIAERLGESGRSEILNWLLVNFLPHVSNLAILMAGRPAPPTFENQLREAGKAHFVAIELKGLNESESVEYFTAVASVAKESGNEADTAVAELIENLSEDDRRAIFYALCDSEEPPHVRPILLALAIDYLVVAGQPLPGLLRSLQEAKQMSKEDRERLHIELGSALTTLLREDWRPADEVIVALGWLRKGATVELLMAITDFTQGEIEAALEKIHSLSFVKIRPRDERIFLHDEMYKMLWDHLLSRLADAQRERMLGNVIDYYTRKIHDLAHHIAIYEPWMGRSDDPRAKGVRSARLELQDLKVESLHYQLENNAADGFEAYFRYAEEAVGNPDHSFDARLHTELYNFMREHDPDGQAPVIINGTLERADVTADAAVRKIKRTYLEDHQKAIEIAEILRQDFSDLFNTNRPLAQAELDSWEALSRIYYGQVEEARKLLERSLSLLEQPSSQRIRRAAILARTYNNLGFLCRSQGKHFGAIYYYQQALPLWRFTNIAVEQATTLNNRAFALAEIGNFKTAEPLAWDARYLRERMGLRLPVGYSLTTLAHIKIRENALEEARKLAERALIVAADPDIQSQRVRGFALVPLAEAKRRSSDWEPNTPDQTVDLLAEAATHAEEAVKIFQEKQENLRQVEALIELGCIQRDWAKVKRENCSVTGELSQLVEASRTSLEEAASLAEQKLVPYLVTDALVNLAWLNYYIGAEWDSQLEKRILEHIGPEYRIFDQISANALRDRLAGQEKLEIIYSFLVHLSKLEILKGHIAFDKFNEQHSNKNKTLEKALEHYTLAMLYDTLITQGLVHRGMRKSMEQIYDHLKPLNVDELRHVYDMVARLEGKYGPRESSWPMHTFLEAEFGPRNLIVELAESKENLL
jgi:tetratricopeptide (TPR) repeat protein